MDRIIIIGPVSVGKTTISNKLSELLNREVVHLDDYRLKYYGEIGYSEEQRQEIQLKVGWGGVYRYWKVFDSHSVIRFLEDFPEHILDLGGGSSVCEYDDELDKLAQAFISEPNVFLLLPFENNEESLKFLNNRTGWTNEGRNINRHFLNHKSNRIIAKHVIYVADRTTDQICAEIVSKLT